MSVCFTTEIFLIFQANQYNFVLKFHKQVQIQCNYEFLLCNL